MFKSANHAGLLVTLPLNPCIKPIMKLGTKTMV